MIDCAPATCETLARTAPHLVEAAMPTVIGLAVAVGVAANTDEAGGES
jgi:biopolymer transport protein ExbB/TolQ